MVFGRKSLKPHSCNKTLLDSGTLHLTSAPTWANLSILYMRAILKRTDTKSHTHAPTAAKTQEDSNGSLSSPLRFATVRPTVCRAGG